MQITFLKNNTLLKTYDNIRTSFWFVPCNIILLALVLCALLVWLDSVSSLANVPVLNFLYHSDPDITRDLLSTVASSIMTVVSITFSITMVALTNASSQFGPRLLRNFMNDSSTQTVLGTFIAIFLYCLVLIRVTDDFANGEHLPGLAIAGAILLTLHSIFLLIYFIHHVATNLQADNIINKVYETLQTNISSIFAEHKENEALQASQSTVTNKLNAAPAIKSHSSGYVQAINYLELVELLEGRDAYMKLTISPGDFVTTNMLIGYYSGDASDSSLKQILNCISLGAKRTPIQDPEFAFLQLVEIALRALSPSINDPYSAIACIDKLSATLCHLTHQEFPIGVSCDGADQPRICFKTANFKGIANTAYDQIRQNAINHLAVQLRLLEGLILISEQASNEEHWDFISQQTNMIEHDLKQQSFIESDSREVQKRLSKLRSLINQN